MTARIRIPEPCTESWEAMRPVESGRFCERCAHVVPDLTQASDAELVGLMREGKFPKCARFTGDQLDRALEPTGHDPVRALQLLALGAMALLPASAEAKKKPLKIDTTAIKLVDIAWDNTVFIGDVCRPQPSPTTWVGFSVPEQPFQPIDIVTGIAYNPPFDPAICEVPLMDPELIGKELLASTAPTPAPPLPAPRPRLLAVLFRRIGIRSGNPGSFFNG